MTHCPSRPRLCLLNPNANAATTAMMTAIANEAAQGQALFVGQTMASGPSIITDEQALEAAGPQIVAAGRAAAASGCAGILISGFGDPGLEALRRAIAIPVTGIAEASMAVASAGGRRFSVVTTTPNLMAAITRTAERYGCLDALASLRITPGDAEETMSDPEALARALLALCHDAVAIDGAQAIIIGGGPLAIAARTIAHDIPVPLIEPVDAGAALALRRALEWPAGGARR